MNTGLFYGIPIKQIRCRFPTHEGDCRDFLFNRCPGHRLVQAFPDKFSLHGAELLIRYIKFA